MLLYECYSRHFPVKVAPELPLFMLHCAEISLYVHTVIVLSGQIFLGFQEPVLFLEDQEYTAVFVWGMTSFSSVNSLTLH